MNTIGTQWVGRSIYELGLARHIAEKIKDGPPFLPLSFLSINYFLSAKYQALCWFFSHLLK